MSIGRDSPSVCLPLYSDRHGFTAESRSDLVSPRRHPHSRVTPDTIRDGTVATRVRNLGGTAGFVSPTSNPRIRIQRASAPRVTDADGNKLPPPWAYPRSLRPADNVRPSDLKISRPRRSSRVSPFTRRDSKSSPRSASPPVSYKSPHLVMQFPAPRRLVSVAALGQVEDEAKSSTVDHDHQTRSDSRFSDEHPRDDNRKGLQGPELNSSDSRGSMTESISRIEENQTQLCRCEEAGLNRTHTELQRWLSTTEAESRAVTQPMPDSRSSSRPDSTSPRTAYMITPAETESLAHCTRCGGKIYPRVKLTTSVEIATGNGNLGVPWLDSRAAPLPEKTDLSSEGSGKRQFLTPLSIQESGTDAYVRRYSEASGEATHGSVNSFAEERRDSASEFGQTRTKSMSSVAGQSDHINEAGMDTKGEASQTSISTQGAPAPAPTHANPTINQHSEIASAIAIRFGDFIDAVIISRKMDKAATVSTLDVSNPDVTRIQQLSRDLIQATRTATHQSSDVAGTSDGASSGIAGRITRSGPLADRRQSSKAADGEVKSGSVSVSVPALMQLVDAAAKDLGLDLSPAATAEPAAVARRACDVPRALFASRQRRIIGATA